MSDEGFTREMQGIEGEKGNLMSDKLREAVETAN